MDCVWPFYPKMNPLIELNRKIKATEDALARSREILKDHPDLQAAQVNHRSLERRYNRLLEEREACENWRARKQA